MSIELKAVGDCLEINNRVLRYIVESEMVPGIGKVNQGRGSRRTLTKKQAVQVAAAAMLHQQGFRGPVIRSIVTEVGKQWPTRQDSIEITIGGAMPVTIKLATKVLGTVMSRLEPSTTASP